MVEYIVIKFWGILWKNSKGKFTKKPLGILGGYIMKEPGGFVWGTLLGIFWKNPKDKFKKYPLGIWVGTF